MRKERALELLQNTKKYSTQDGHTTSFKEHQDSLKTYYKTIFENTGTAMAIYGDDHIIRLVNRSFEQLSGYTKQEIEHKLRWYDFVLEEDLKLYQQYHKQRSDNTGNPPKEHNFTFLTKNAERKTIHIRITVVPETKDRIASLLDITEKKKTEEYFKELFFTMGEGVCFHEMIYDSSGNAVNYKILDANPAYERILTLRKEEIKGKLSTEIYNTLLPPFLNIYNTVVETGNSYRFHEYFEPMNKHFSISAFHMGEERFATIFSDITDQVKSQQLIQESEHKLSSIIDKVTVGILVLDTQTQEIILSNPEIEHISGYSTNELLGKNIFMIHPQEEKSFILSMIERLLRGELKTASNIPVQKKDGELRYCDITSTKERIAGKDVLIAIFSDITDKKIAEDEIRKSQEKYRTYIDHSPDGVFIANNKGKYLEVNKAAAEITGYSEEELLSMNLVDITAPEFREVAADSFKSLQEKGASCVDSCFIHKDGSRHWWNVDAVKLSDNRYLGFTQDITRRKTIELELNQKNKELQTLNQLKSNFLNMTSHELRTPMTAINGYLQMLQNNLLGATNPEQKEAIDVILRNSERLDRLVNDILDTSRLESGTMKFIPKETDAKELINEVKQIMQSEADTKNITITARIQENLPLLTLDQDRIKQVLNNLIKNAIKFSPTHTEITLEAQDNSDTILFKVSDQGRGIPHDQQQNIFNIFFQVESGIDRSYGGTGLGLTICKGIIEGHGGDIWVESQDEKGSTILFTLPKKPIHDAEGTFEKLDVFNVKNQGINDDKYRKEERILESNT